MRTADLIAKQFGVQTMININPLTASIGTTAAQLLSNNPNRLAFTIINLSSNNMYIAFDPTVSAAKGIFLTPNGGSATLTMMEDFESTCWEVWGVAGAAASAVYVIEVLISSEIAG